MRDFAQIKLSIWNDDAFLDLSHNAQLLFFVLISHPTLNRAGVGTWHPGRLAGLCATWTRADVERAGRELIDGRFVVIDTDTDEFLVRTFVRHDGLMKQRNLATTMAREFAAVGSRSIKGVVVWELRRLHEEHPEFKGWESDEALALLKKRAVDPSSDPSVYPHVDPSVDPYVKGAIDPKVDPSIDPSVRGEPKGSVDPSVDPSPTTATTTTTFSRHSKRGEMLEGVRGVRGERGNQTAANDGADSAASNPPPQNLDELAAAHAASQPDPRRCPEHQHLAPGTVPNCGQCAEARIAYEEHQTAAKADEREQRRNAINNCTHCDDNGWVKGTNPARRCNHKPPRKQPPF